MSEKFPSQTQDKFTVRFPDGLRDAIAERAKANGRSMNSEIVQILEDAITDEGDDLHQTDVHTLREMIKIQADMLNKYSEAITYGTEVLSEVKKHNKKPT